MLRATALAEPPSDSALIDPETARVMENVGMIYGSYYATAMETLVEIKDDALSEGLPHPDVLAALEDRGEELERYAVDEEEIPFYRVQALMALIIRALLETWWMIALIRHMNIKPDARLASLARAEATMRASVLVDLMLVLRDPAPGLYMLLERTAPRALEGLAAALRVDSRVADVADIGYGALRLGDLEQLARRDAGVRNAYGMTLDRAFERQLSLLFTSFGLAAIAGVPGRRYVDLVCIGADPEPQTLVVEAKSTSRPRYEFRAADQRALVEHVEEVKGTLRGLPPVELVLLVAPDFVKGAATRLKAAENALHVPCRGVSTGLLVMLRERHLGPIPSAILVEQLQAGPVLADTGTIEAVLERAQAPTKAWQEFVSVLRHANRSRGRAR